MSADQTGWNFADLWETVATQIPDALAQQQGTRTSTWAEFNRRANGVAAALLQPDSQEQDKVAQYLYNAPEYLESIFAAFKIGFAAVNTNYRYTADELVYLWDNADVVAVVFHGAFVEQCELGSPEGASDPHLAVGRRRQRTVPGVGHPVRGRGRRRHRRQRGRRVGSQRRPPPAALHRRHHRHAQGRDVAAGRPVRRARREQQAAHAARSGSRRGARTHHQGRPAEHAGGTVDARHRTVQRDQQPDGRRQHHHDGRSPLQRRGVPRLRRSCTASTPPRSSATRSPSRSCGRWTRTRIGGTSRPCG